MKYRKLFIISMFVPMTASTIGAANWQYNRYNKSKDKF